EGEGLLARGGIDERHGIEAVLAAGPPGAVDPAALAPSVDAFVELVLAAAVGAAPAGIVALAHAGAPLFLEFATGSSFRSGAGAARWATRRRSVLRRAGGRSWRAGLR